MKQTDMILEHLKGGHTLTPLEALHMFGCFRLGARIHDLKAAGHRIDSELVEVNGKHVARYRLLPKEEPLTREPCSACGGTGREYVPSERLYDACMRCNGSGYGVTLL